MAGLLAGGLARRRSRALVWRRDRRPDPVVDLRLARSRRAPFGAVRPRLRLAGLGSFSYYEPGDFLALHRDIVTCDVTLLTCLRDTAAGTPDRSGLRIYPAYARLPLTQLRSEAAPPHIDLYLDRDRPPSCSAASCRTK